MDPIVQKAPKTSPLPTPVQLIEKTRDGVELKKDEVRALVRGLLSGELADYQMSAWLMAAYLNGLSDAEMVALTEAMLHSGEVLSMKSVRGPKIDKHSTGGVGDKVSLPLAPLVAAAGLFVPMISGRGLGHTGGTLDKLEAVPGYNTQLDKAQFEKIVSKVGCAIIGQTPRIAPADKKIYALRDVTGTVACRQLIVASILSKKLAAGLDGLVLDVKVGRGAFMVDKKSATALARSLVETSTALGTPATALLTNMDTPLGVTIGNALEVRESIEILKNEGPKDSRELTLRLGAEMLLMAGLAPSRAAAEKKLRDLLASGHALERFARMVEAQGGDPRIVDDLNRLPKAPHRSVLFAQQKGYVVDIEPRGLAEAALRLGAGRLRAEDRVEPSVGLELLVRPGDEVEKGTPLARIHARSASAARAQAELVRRSFSIARRPPQNITPLVLGTITGKGRPS